MILSTDLSPSQVNLIYEIISHPYFQRLRHIKQLGLTDYVYPGRLHTRFQHALGAMHLMGKVLDNLRLKGVEISNEEYEAIANLRFCFMISDTDLFPTRLENVIVVRNKT